MNKKSSKTQSADLINVAEIDLLKAVVEITTRNQKLTADDIRELDSINEEFKRRDALSFLPSSISAYNHKLHR